MKYVSMQGRRQFLQGAGGAALALPFLPSLLRTRNAEAQAGVGYKCFAYLALPHGGAPQSAFFPADSSLTDMQTYAGFAIRKGALNATTVGAEAQLSPVLRAPATELTPRLLSKMNLLRGVDLAHYPGHGFGQALGNFGDITGGAIDEGTDWNRPTVDQVMGWSPGFYANSPVREQVIVVGSTNMSFANSNPAAGTGAVQAVPASAPTNVALFEKLFGTQTQPAPSTGAPPPPNTLLVDQVLENYRRLQNSGKLSAVDKLRIDDHVARIAELQRKLAQPAAVFVGTPPARPTATTESGDDYAVDPTAQARTWNLWTDIAAAAFSVGASRVFTACVTDSFSTEPGDWHDVAHSGQDVRMAKMVPANQLFFQNVMLAFASKLDAIALGDGTTLLDASLIAWSHESGSLSHMGTGMPIITFGSAQGFLHTGLYCDYRNLNKVLQQEGEPSWHGLVTHQWLGTVLQAMGVPKTAYAGLSGGAAYPAGRPSDPNSYIPGDPNVRYPGTEAPYPDAVWTAASEPLPWLHG